jgi:threonine dehydratase
MITAEDIAKAHDRIKPYVRRTPVLTSDAINEMVGGKVMFKCENLQEIGAFKARGAMNAVLSLREEDRKKGVATHSSGNHAQALARAAKLVGIQSFIVMPFTAAEIKKRGVIEFGGRIFECEATQQSRESTLAQVVMETGAAEIHPFNNEQVMTGQATAAKEFFEEFAGMDFIIAPVGGGGLLSGTALATKYFSPGTKVVAAEPEGADDAYRAFFSGKIEVSQSNSIADGLLTSLGTKTFPIIRDNVSEVITVSDAEIIKAMRILWERLKIIVEPSGAVPFAALLKQRSKFAGKTSGIIISGGNVDFDRAMKLFAEV